MVTREATNAGCVKADKTEKAGCDALLGNATLSDGSDTLNEQCPAVSTNDGATRMPEHDDEVPSAVTNVMLATAEKEGAGAGAPPNRRGAGAAQAAQRRIAT